ncbi:AEC family transporter [Quadrisphaera setariae]|uniref:AEC family transporter n=1 Tax=Quadrisphaera setariae TaxID=2593304 RepID=UPI001C9C71AC|nr:AEC family transporter [Quadrisphaera setariae]
MVSDLTALVGTGVVPVVLLLVAGAALRRWALRDEQLWSGLGWLVYWVFTPALFVSVIGQTDLGAVPAASLALSTAVPIVVVTGLVLGAGLVLRAPGPRLASLVQGSIRLNTYVGLLLASALHGAAGVAAFALAGALVVPLVNVISVVALTRLGDQVAGVRPSLPREVVTNPFVLGCAAGLLVNAAGVPLPAPVVASLDVLSAPALACGTLVAGAALRLRLRRSEVAAVLVVSGVKLVVLPLAAAWAATGLGVAGAALTGVVLACALPTAPSSYVLAARLGGDAPLTASLTAVQTVASVLTLPAVLSVAQLLATR